MTGRPGRPRSAAERDTRGDVLAAAAALFSSVGYTATSTYAIAERAGVRQASIYHHFRGKDVLLRTLLMETIAPSLALADRLVAAPGDPAARLWVLCDGDARWLADGPVNIGRLMQLPEVETAPFAEFAEARARLRSRYDELVAAVLGTSAPGEATLVFGLVEGVIAARRTGGTAAARAVAPLVADAARGVLGLDDGRWPGRAPPPTRRGPPAVDAPPPSRSGRRLRA
ncbi:TetR/AcrR family transcriptional regulator [Cellulomonas endometrii]|uniref:TetR/AcrR family transcriptional regulator n=1 Tax=Cellulomonas endometrii TaxID=3036301 RepID=UPI0024AE69B2|nr:TetR/AcrR family transcriptional regulator [Cellulomonas endometrii]